MAKPGTLKVDHHVVSAEGTRYVVRYVAVRTYDGVSEEQADLYELSEDGRSIGERISLPTAELKRVPRQQLPPITGIPSERPRCVLCDKPLAPEVDASHDMQYRVTARRFTGWKGYRADAARTAFFCTHHCEAAFARAAYAAGYRITRKDTKA